MDHVEFRASARGSESSRVGERRDGYAHDGCDGWRRGASYVASSRGRAAACSDRGGREDGAVWSVETTAVGAFLSEGYRRRFRRALVRKIWETGLRSELVDRLVGLVASGRVSVTELQSVVKDALRRRDSFERNGRYGVEKAWHALGSWCKGKYAYFGLEWTPTNPSVEPAPPPKTPVNASPELRDLSVRPDLESRARVERSLSAREKAAFYAALPNLLGPTPEGLLARTADDADEVDVEGDTSSNASGGCVAVGDAFEVDDASSRESSERVAPRRSRGSSSSRMVDVSSGEVAGRVAASSGGFASSADACGDSLSSRRRRVARPCDQVVEEIVAAAESSTAAEVGILEESWISARNKVESDRGVEVEVADVSMESACCEGMGASCGAVANSGTESESSSRSRQVADSASRRGSRARRAGVVSESSSGRVAVESRAHVGVVARGRSSSDSLLDYDVRGSWPPSRNASCFLTAAVDAADVGKPPPT